MDREKYERTELDITLFSKEDVIATSDIVPTEGDDEVPIRSSSSRLPL